MQNKLVLVFVKYWVPVIVWLGVIFYFSSIPNLSLPLSGYDIDKVYHVIEYAILGYLVSRLLKNGRFPFSKKQILVYTLAVLFSFLYGITDELHQYFVPGRLCSLLDCVSDGLGAGIGAYIKR